MPDPDASITRSVHHVPGIWPFSRAHALSRSRLPRGAVAHEFARFGEILCVDGDLAFCPHLTGDQVVAGAPEMGADVCGPVRFRLTYNR